MKKEIFSHLLISFVYFTFISLLRWQWSLNLIPFWFGAIIGTFLLDIDHFFFVFLTRREASCSQKIREFWRKKEYKKALLHLFATHREQRELVFHNCLFQPIFYLFILFVLTSTGSLFGSGLVMAMALHLLKDEWEEYFRNPSHLRHWLFWQVKRKISFEGQRNYLIIMSLIFFLLTLLLI